MRMKERSREAVAERKGRRRFPGMEGKAGFFQRMGRMDRMTGTKNYMRKKIAGTRRNRKRNEGVFPVF